MNSVIFDLHNNEWIRRNCVPGISGTEEDDSNRGLSLDDQYLELRYSRRYVRSSPLVSGFLTDQEIFKLVQIFSGLTKFAHQPKITVGQIRVLLMQMEAYAEFPASTISFSNALKVFNWFENLKVESAIPIPDLPPNIINQICKSFYGNNQAILKRKILLSKAMNDLLTTDNTLLNIGLEAGYRTRDYFITAFKKEFLLSPGVLRLFYRH